MGIKTVIRRYWIRGKIPSLLIFATVYILCMYLTFRNSSEDTSLEFILEPILEPIPEPIRNLTPYLLLDYQPLMSFSLDNQRHREDVISLFNVSEFEFIVNQPKICDNRSDIRSIVIIHTAPKHFERREAIRHTWGSLHSDIAPVIFLVGQTEHPEHLRRLNEEIKTHQDLVQGSFIDHYHNLTYKYLMGLLWTRIYCRQVSIILKGDDDIFVNMPRYLNLIEELKQANESAREQRTITCYEIVEGGVVRRSVNSKWNVPFTEYPHSTFPKYCPGAVVILNNRAIDAILDSVNYSPYVWVDDAYVTGVLAATANSEPRKLNESYICRRLPHKANATLLQYFKQAAFGPLQLSIKDMYRLWSVLD